MKNGSNFIDYLRLFLSHKESFVWGRASEGKAEIIDTDYGRFDAHARVNIWNELTFCLTERTEVKNILVGNLSLVNGHSTPLYNTLASEHLGHGKEQSYLYEACVCTSSNPTCL